MAVTKLERKNYAALGAPVGPYVHAVKHGGLLFLSGLTAYGTAAQSRGLSEQADATFEQIAIVAAEEGTTLASLVKVTMFVTGFYGVDELRKVLFRRYGAELPASSLVQVSALFSPDLHVEIEAILAI